ncbi:hypothetical protein B0H21DRAFT_254 [Amylocystis lapponica]|nr:hypothetical protein B0H21DRAFT_254 [Amylocystis lapponica]
MCDKLVGRAVWNSSGLLSFCHCPSPHHPALRAQSIYRKQSCCAYHVSISTSFYIKCTSKSYGGYGSIGIHCHAPEHAYGSKRISLVYNRSIFERISLKLCTAAAERIYVLVFALETLRLTKSVRYYSLLSAELSPGARSGIRHRSLLTPAGTQNHLTNSKHHPVVPVSSTSTMSDVHFVFMEPTQSKSAPHPSLPEAWRAQIAEHLAPADQARIAVVESMLGQLEPPHTLFDCIVSPANSYGIMDGGSVPPTTESDFDYYLSKEFSPPHDIMALTRTAQAAIKDAHFGFAPPGTCTLAPLPPALRTNARFPRCRVLAVCPTMRLPEPVPWHRDLVYNTMWGLLVALEHWNARAAPEERIVHVAMSGLATGIGGIPKMVCARQMVLALKHFWDARSEEGREKWAHRDFPDWTVVIPIAEEVVPEDE